MATIKKAEKSANIQKDSMQHLPKKITSKVKVQQWYEQPITMDCFEVKVGNDKMYYARHLQWKEKIYIGPYETKEDVEKVLSDYIKNAKKDRMKRREVKNLHSAIIEDFKTFF